MKMTTKITEHNCSDILDAIGDTLSKSIIILLYNLSDFNTIQSK